jgi:hypothetical protein
MGTTEGLPTAHIRKGIAEPCGIMVKCTLAAERHSWHNHQQLIPIVVRINTNGSQLLSLLLLLERLPNKQRSHYDEPPEDEDSKDILSDF